MKNKKIYRKYVNLKSGQIHIRVAGDKKSKKRPLLCFHLSPVSGIIFENLPYAILLFSIKWNMLECSELLKG